MAASTVGNFYIIQDEFYAGVVESVQQNAAAFNAASGNAIRMLDAMSAGNFRIEAFFDVIGSLVARRVTTSVSAVTDLGLSSDEWAWPKLNRRVGPVNNTLDAFRKIADKAAGALGTTPERAFSYVLGQQVGPAKAQDWLNSGVRAAVAALGGVTSGGVTGSGLVYDATGLATRTMVSTTLITGRSRFGDAAGRIRAWVMHSKPFHDLMADQAADITDRLAGATIYAGTVGSLGIPVIVTDSAALVNTNGISTGLNSYYTLGLVENGVIIQDAESDAMVTDLVTGKENLMMRIQGEHAYITGVKGFTFDTSKANPTDAQVADGSNWTNQMADVKLCGGVRIETA